MFLITIFFFIQLSLSATYGVDAVKALTSTNVNCLLNNYFDGFIILRSWKATGAFDSNIVTAYKNVVSKGFETSTIDTYFAPCYSGGNVAGQVSSVYSSLQSNSITVNRIWFNLDGTWGSDVSTNKAFFEEMISQGISLGMNTGIYCDRTYWINKFGESYTYSQTSKVLLWYPNHNNVESFSDFVQFGGWTTPYMKQYTADQLLCTAMVSYNYRA